MKEPQSPTPISYSGPYESLEGSSDIPLPIRQNPRNLRTHILRLLGPKTILYKAFDLF